MANKNLLHFSMTDGGCQPAQPSCNKLNTLFLTFNVSNDCTIVKGLCPQTPKQSIRTKAW